MLISSTGKVEYNNGMYEKFVHTLYAGFIENELSINNSREIYTVYSHIRTLSPKICLAYWREPNNLVIVDNQQLWDEESWIKDLFETVIIMHRSERTLNHIGAGVIITRNLECAKIIACHQINLLK